MSDVPPADSPGSAGSDVKMSDVDAWFLMIEVVCCRFNDFSALEELLCLRATSKEHREVCRPDVIATIPARPSWGSHRQRRYFVRALSNIANQGDRAAITALIKCLNDPAWEVRAATVWALKKVVEKDNEEVILVLSKYTACDSRCEVRIAAVLVLAAIIEKPNSKIVTATRALLLDGHHDVRVAAARSLRELVDEGNIPSIRELARYYQDKTENREAAKDSIEILGKVSFPGGDDTSGALAAAQKGMIEAGCSGIHYNENDMVKFVYHCVTTDAPQSGNCFYMPLGDGIHVVVDVLGKAGGMYHSIMKGMLYKFNGSNFVEKCSFSEWKQSVEA
eukprot:NODE_396_length_1601_cov_313.849935.p1 GENE.NODE_396_length_1601_cov_313.849935~~NODE_396_length_1601_cov_313.849935.p1  ORF type:complete len:335 (-),score=84.10 NODE_396_length_1601_cov_313.849935:474-1478(-)